MKMSIVFFGTPEFASYSLEKLVQDGIEVKALVTAPDRPAGRGYELKESDCKKAALSLGIPVLQPEKLKAQEFLDELCSLNADLFVVVAFRMLPKDVWSMPRLGTINLHASLLPQFRGAAPINWAIINGEKETGVTTFMIDEEIDTGGILEQRIVPIKEEDNLGSLYQKLKIEGATLLSQTINKLFNDELTPQSQKQVELSSLKEAPKINKEDCRIDWERPVRQVLNLIRGMSPYPAAFTELECEGRKAERLKIFLAEIGDTKPSDVEVGNVVMEGGKLLIACADRYLSILELQKAGKRKMTVTEFLSGINKSEKCCAT